MAKEKKEEIKSALELAMEKIDSSGAPAALTEEQKEMIAEVERTAQARIAEIEIMTARRLEEARAAGDAEAEGRLEEEKAGDISRIRGEAGKKKQRIRDTGADAP